MGTVRMSGKRESAGDGLGSLWGRIVFLLGFRKERVGISGRMVLCFAPRSVYAVTGCGFFWCLFHLSTAILTLVT